MRCEFLIALSMAARMVVAADDAPAQRADAPAVRLQETDDEAPALAPVKARDERTAQEIDAATHYMAGRLHESRNRPADALAEYAKAIERNPRSIEAYRAAIHVALRMEKNDDAFKYAQRAVELAPDDFELLRQIGAYLANENRVDEAIKYLRQASASPKLSKTEPFYVQLMRDLGVMHQIQDDKAAAAECYLIVFDALTDPAKYKLDPRMRSSLLADQRTGFERIGTVLLEGNKLDEAGKAFDLAAKGGRAAAGNLSYNKARLLLAKQDPTAALTELQTYFDAQRQTKGRDAYKLLGEILAALGKESELISRLETLAEKDSRNNSLQYFLAERLANDNQLERARQVYEKSLGGSGDLAGLVGLASVHRRMRQAEPLIDALGRAMAKLTGEDDGSKLLAEELETVAKDEALFADMMAAGRKLLADGGTGLSFEKAYLLVRIAVEREDHAAAGEFYKAAIEKNREKASLLYIEWGKSLLLAKKYAEAVQVYQTAIDDRSTAGNVRLEFYFQLSNAQELSGSTDAALQTVTEAKKLAPLPLFDWQEGWIYYHSRQFDKAVPIFEKVIETHKDSEEIVRRCQFSLSNIFVMQGDIRRGEEVLEKIYEADPEDTSVCNDLGYLYADQGKKLDQAEQMIRKAVAAEPDNAAYQDSLGWVLFKQGKYDEAMTWLEKALKDPSGGDGTIWEHLGDCQEKLGRLDDAKVSWKKAWDASKDEKFPDAKLLDRLRQRLPGVE